MSTITEAYDLHGYSSFAYEYEVLFPEVSLYIITMITAHLVLSYLNRTPVFGISQGNGVNESDEVIAVDDDEGANENKKAGDSEHIKSTNGNE